MIIHRSTASPQNQVGDTLVEVLISIAIVAVVVTGAYALASRSLHQGITASEHSQALKLAEGQLESLKFRQQHSAEQDFLNTFGNNTQLTNSNFCLDASASDPSAPNWQPVFNPTAAGDSTTTDLTTTGMGMTYKPACAVQSSKYFMNINIQAGPPNPSYLITVRWDAIGGGTNQTQLYYRF